MPPTPILLKLDSPAAGDLRAARRAVGDVYRQLRAGRPVAVCFSSRDESAAEGLRGLIQEAGLPVDVLHDNAVDAVRAALDAGLVAVLAGPDADGSIAASLGAEEISPDASVPASPLRVVLLGLGAVGRGVLERLLDHPERFTPVAALARDLERHAASGVPRELLTADPEEALSRDADVVVELIGGTTLAADLMIRALHAGRHVVTGNKASIADRWPELRAARDASGKKLLYSAAVGGAMPSVETVRRLAAGPGVAAIRGVLNGTTNFILNSVAAGQPFDAALAEAQRLGYAEADPTMDIEGADAAQKLLILSRETLPSHGDADALPFNAIQREPLASDTVGAAIERAGGRPLRHVASLSVRDGAPAAAVKIEAVDPADPLADLPGATNRLAVTTADGTVTFVTAAGAGRWPTAESAMGDLLELARTVSNEPSP